MNKPKGRIIDSEHGLFIFTPDGVYRYEPGDRCFKEVQIKDAQDVVIASIGTVDDDPDLD